MDKNNIRNILNEEKNTILDQSTDQACVDDFDGSEHVLKHCNKLFISIMDPDNFNSALECTTVDRKKVCNLLMGKSQFSLLHIAVLLKNRYNLEKYLIDFRDYLDIDQLTGVHSISAMHIAAQVNSPEGIDLLLKYKAKIDLQDYTKQTPLYHAVFCKNKNAVTHLINNAAALNTYINPNLTTLAFVLRNMPSAKKAIIDQLDKCITSEVNSLIDKYNIKFDFTQWKMSTGEGQVQTMHAFDLVHVFAKEEEKFQGGLSDSDLIEHPLVQKMLENAWTSRMMWIAYWFIFAFKFLFMLVIAIYVCNGRQPQWLCYCLFCLALVDSLRNLIAVYSFATSSTATKWDKTIVTYYFASFQFYCYWTRLIGSFLFYFSENDILLEMISPMIFLAGWFNFMLMVGETKLFGLYMDMFFSVLKHFLKIIRTFSIFLIGFAICFWLYFHQQTSFSSWHLAITKIFVMFIGEIDYDSLIDNYLNKTIELTARNGSIVYMHPSEAPQWYLIFPLTCISLFVITVPIVLQGLLIGMVVNDITEIKGKAAARQSKRDANHLELLVTSIDSAFSLFFKIVSCGTKFLCNCYRSTLKAQMDDIVSVEYFFGNKSQPEYLHKAHQIAKRNASKV